MKILMIDKYYFIKGGAERYYFELTNLLQTKGHTVIPFSMKHENNYETIYNLYFVNNIEYNNTSFLPRLLKTPLYFSRMIYSGQARKRLEKLIETTKPDLAHLHMIEHQLSPSILHTIKKYDIPIIQTVHQYKLVCPNYRLYNMRTNTICEKCLNGHTFHPIFERCHRNSSFAGFMIAVESGIHRIMDIYNKNIDLFHVPSHFMGEKLKQGGIPAYKIEHLFYTLNLADYPPHYSYTDYFVYYGRLAREKGILTLLKAMKQVNKSKLILIGDGPQKDELEEYVKKNELNNIVFAGLKEGNELKKMVSDAKFVVVPSEWYDNSPLVIYESASMGKPVIGANIGGIPELIDHEKTGLVYTPGDVEELAAKINYLLDNPNIIKKYSRSARIKAEKEFSPEYHYQKIINKYQKLLNAH